MLMPSIFGNDFMNDFFGGFPYKSNGTMQTDVSETDKGYKVTMNLPGYQKEDIKGEVKDGYLTVTATTSKNNDEKDKDGKYIRKERYSGSCSRSFYVGDAVTQDDVKAKFENGVLTLEVPKKEEAARRPGCPRHRPAGASLCSHAGRPDARPRPHRRARRYVRCRG